MRKTIEQKRKEVAAKLTKTLKKLERLPKEKFKYSSFISVPGRKCGTVCCVAGWYPKWFPEAGLRYKTSPLSSLIKFGIAGRTEFSINNVNEKLSKYHKITTDLVNHLFYGEGLTYHAPGYERLQGIGLSASKRRVQALFRRTIQRILDGKYDEFLL